MERMKLLRTLKTLTSLERPREQMATLPHPPKTGEPKEARGVLGRARGARGLLTGPRGRAPGRGSGWG